jgi:hypothetical protein
MKEWQCPAGHDLLQHLHLAHPEYLHCRRRLHRQGDPMYKDMHCTLYIYYKFSMCHVLLL